MKGNQHYALALERTGWVHAMQESEGQTDATHVTTALDALTEATLALAYEQRTANLIALLTASFTAVRINGVDCGALGGQITERLDLE